MLAKREGEMLQMENTSCAQGLELLKCSVDPTMLKGQLAKESSPGSKSTSPVKDGPVASTKQHLIHPTVEKHGYSMPLYHSSHRSKTWM